MAFKRVFIGWDSREVEAYNVCKASLLKHSSIPLHIVPIKLQDVRKLYKRPVDKLASTEFSLTRFMVPYLSDYDGWSLFVDCDFVFMDDVAKLFDQVDDKYAIMCAQHDYNPTSETKMDGKVQYQYPRKNWSSMMLFNCGHEGNKELTLDVINDINNNGAWYHQFQWLDDFEIGEISHEWNWLVGWYSEPDDGKPKALHYTEGGPWFEAYHDCEYAEEWLKYTKDS